MTTLTFRQPRLVALAILVILAAGASSLLSIGRQEDPTITNLFATVTTVYPGADPARVEALVTAEIEEVVREIPEVDTIQSTSATGVSIIRIELSDRVQDGVIETVWSEIRDALDDARARFPEGVLAPEFDSDGTGAFAAIIALSPARDGVPMSIASRYAEELGDRLRGVSGTKLVDLFGLSEEEVLVRLDPVRAAALGITADAVSAAIAAADAKMQAGRLLGGGNDLILDVAGEIEALDRVRQVI
ncbi:MAG: efflux RND transporter permease subunit, partial [Pseudomonadota bacterium]